MTLNPGCELGLLAIDCNVLHVRVVHVEFQ